RPPYGEVLVGALDLAEVVRGERVEEMPDRRTREPVPLCHSEPRGRPGRVLHALRGAFPYAALLAVAPDVRRKNRLVARVDAVTDGLADEVCAGRPPPEAVPLEQLPPRA